MRLKRRGLNKRKYYPFELENTVKTAFASMESICERDFLKIYTAFEKSTRGKWKMDLFSHRLRFNFKNRLSRITIPSIWKRLEGVVFENGPGYSRIYLSYLSCKLDFFTCLLVTLYDQDYHYAQTNHVHTTFSRYPARLQTRNRCQLRQTFWKALFLLIMWNNMRT